MSSEIANPGHRFKICCIQSRGEAELAIRYGASALGFVSKMPSGPGVIEEAEIAEIVSHISPDIETFLLTSQTTAFSIIAQLRYCKTSTIQLCDRVDAEVYEQIKHAHPSVQVIQVIHVVDEHSIEEAKRVASNVDAILLDTGNRSAAIPELGGTGRTHNWTLSRRIRNELTVPLYLAGGLNASNVSAAINKVRPFAVDVCSGVRDGGKLDEARLAEFVDALS